VSLGFAMFGKQGEYTEKLTAYCTSGGCPPGKHLSLDILAGDCKGGSAKFNITEKFMTTPQSVWCQLKNAGASTQALLGIGDAIIFIAPIITLIYAAKEIPKVGALFAKVEGLGFRPEYQKIAVCASWVALWLFLLVAMYTYAAAVPDSLGVGVIEFESSFGFLRLCFLFVSVLTALLGVHFTNAWSAENAIEAWTEFQETKCCTAKKLLYMLLLTQLVFYMILAMYHIHWEMLLILICGYYLDAKKENFKLIYIVLVSVTILLDGIEIFKFPSFETMTPGEGFTNSLFIMIFALKFAVLGAIYFYSKEEASNYSSFAQLEDGQPTSYMPDGKMEDEIAE